MNFVSILQLLHEMFRKVARYYLILIVPAVLMLCVTAKPLVRIFLAPEYLEGYRVISVVSCGVLFFGLSTIFTMVFGYFKRSDIAMFCYLGAAVLNVILNLIFVPKYGYMAATFTTFVSYIALLTGTVLISRRFFAWEFPFRSLRKVSISSALMGAAVYFTLDRLVPPTLAGLVVSVLVGAISYLVMLVIFKEFTPEEIRKVLNALWPPFHRDRKNIP